MTQSTQPTPSAAPRNAVAMADPLVLFRWLDVILVVLAAPFVVWLVCYVAILWYFIPKLGKVGEQQADFLLAFGGSRTHHRLACAIAASSASGKNAPA